MLTLVLEKGSTRGGKGDSGRPHRGGKDHPLQGPASQSWTGRLLPTKPIPHWEP